MQNVFSIEKLHDTDRKFTTSTTMNILKDPQLMNIHEQHERQRYKLFRRYEQLLPNKTMSPIVAPSTASSASSYTPLIIGYVPRRDSISISLFFVVLVRMV